MRALIMAGLGLCIAQEAAATCNSANCVQSTYPTPNVIVGSPSGLVGSYTVVYKDINGAPLGFVEAWLAEDLNVECNLQDCQQGVVLFANSNGPESILHCGNSCGDANWPYLAGNTSSEGSVTFHARFGGHGTLAVEHERDCVCGQNLAAYTGLKCVEARSTDFNADGNTDQDDKIQFGLALAPESPQPPPIWYDLTLDGLVNAADYLVVANEMIAESPGGVVTPLYRCNGPCQPIGTCTPQALGNQNSFAADAEAPGATPLQATGETTLSWTSPGNDTHLGQQIGVAKEFDVRWSPSPITEANFAAANQLTGEPQPGLPGSSHTLNVSAIGCDGLFFAIRTIDHAGLASPVTAVAGACAPAAITNLGSSCVASTGVLLSFTAPGDDGNIGTAAAYDVRYSTAPITPMNPGTQVTPVPAPFAAGTYQEIAVPGLLACKNYYFSVKTRDEANNWSPPSNAYSVRTRCSGTGTCTPGKATQPDGDVTLQAPTPNPAVQSTRISYEFGPHQHGLAFRVVVYDVAGREVRSLASGTAEGGSAHIDWDLRSNAHLPVPSGIYYVKLSIGDGDHVKSVLVTR